MKFVFLFLPLFIIGCNKVPNDPPEFNSALWKVITANAGGVSITYSVPSSKNGYMLDNTNITKMNLFWVGFDTVGVVSKYTISGHVEDKKMSINQLKSNIEEFYHAMDRNYELSDIIIDGFPSIKITEYLDNAKQIVIAYTYMIFWDNNKSLDIKFTYSRIPGDTQFFNAREKINEHIISSIKINNISKGVDKGINMQAN